MDIILRSRLNRGTFLTFRIQANFNLSGNRCGIFGPSGSDKSTLMHMLAGRLLFDDTRGINLPPDNDASAAPSTR